MPRYKVTTPITVRGFPVKLNPEQLELREHDAVPLEDKEGYYSPRSEFQFKAGELIETEEELPKIYRDRVVEPSSEDEQLLEERLKEREERNKATQERVALRQQHAEEEKALRDRQQAAAVDTARKQREASEGTLRDDQDAERLRNLQRNDSARGDARTPTGGARAGQMTGAATTDDALAHGTSDSPGSAVDQGGGSPGSPAAATTSADRKAAEKPAEPSKEGAASSSKKK